MRISMALSFFHSLGLDVSHFADIAPKALRQAEFVFESCRRFVEGFRAERR